MSKRKIVVTGAAGYVAGRMLPALKERYETVLLDVKTSNRQGEAVAGVRIADLLEKDRDTYRFWSLANARRVIGYAPQDDSQVRFADKIAAITRAVQD